MKRRLDEVNPKENDNEIIELTEIFTDDDFDNGEEDGEIRSFYFSNPDPYAKAPCAERGNHAVVQETAGTG